MNASSLLVSLLIPHLVPSYGIPYYFIFIQTSNDLNNANLINQFQRPDPIYPSLILTIASRCSILTRLDGEHDHRVHSTKYERDIDMFLSAC